MFRLKLGALRALRTTYMQPYDLRVFKALMAFLVRADGVKYRLDENNNRQTTRANQQRREEKGELEMKQCELKEVQFIGVEDFDEFSYGYDFVPGEKNTMRPRTLRPLREVKTWERPRVDPRYYAVEEWGEPIDIALLPKTLLKTGPKRDCPDFLKFKGLGIVSDKFRIQVEKFEPDVHQFIPLALIWEVDQTCVEGVFYFFNIAQSIDSVNGEHSEMPSRVIKFSEYYQKEVMELWEKRRPDGDPYKIVFDSNKIGARHIWQDEYLTTSGPYCSDTFRDSCIADDITGIGFSSESNEVR